MLRLPSRFCLALVTVTLALPGCQKLNHQETVTVGPPGSDNAIKTIEFSSSRNNRKVIVTARSETPVSVYLALDVNIDNLHKRLENQQSVTIDDALTKQEKVKEAKLEATVAGKSKFFVVIANESNKEAAVNLQVTGGS
jgi:hypothetical protein